MRLNKFLALHADLSRRSADRVIEEGRVIVNQHPAKVGQSIDPTDEVFLDGKKIISKTAIQTIMLNKPPGYVCSRAGQGSQTIYDLLPEKYHNLKPVGRLDKDSSGLLLLTNDGDLANKLTHPRYKKTKVYEIEIDRSLSSQDFNKITQIGVDIGEQKPSRFQLEARSKNFESRSGPQSQDSYFILHTSAWRATLAEGRNRQIRRTFSALGYKVKTLHRIEFGPYKLSNLKYGSIQAII